MIPITQGRPDQIERELVEFNKKCQAKLLSMNQEKGRLQLLIIILPDVKGSYGE